MLFSIQSKDRMYYVLVHVSMSWQPLSISAEPMRLMEEGLVYLDPLPSCLLRRISDEMVDTGWNAKSTYLLIVE